MYCSNKHNTTRKVKRRPAMDTRACKLLWKSLHPATARQTDRKVLMRTSRIARPIKALRMSQYCRLNLHTHNTQSTVKHHSNTTTNWKRHASTEPSDKDRTARYGLRYLLFKKLVLRRPINTRRPATSCNDHSEGRTFPNGKLPTRCEERTTTVKVLTMNRGPGEIRPKFVFVKLKSTNALYYIRSRTRLFLKTKVHYTRPTDAHKW